MSPFSGCLGTILQFVLLISIFYMVRCPLTYMKKIDSNNINNYIAQLQESQKTVSAAYPEIDLIREVKFLEEKNPNDEEVKKIDVNMSFLGLDLSKIPQQNLSDWTVYIIPILYIISTFVSMKITTSIQKKEKQARKEAKQTKKIEKNVDEKKVDGEEETTSMVKKEEEEYDVMEQTNKMMSWMMPIMSVSISLVAPLGLALYWLVNNIAMIGERLVLNKVIKDD